ncbi:MAG: dihydroorotase [Exilispira sp.]|nr:dihydroorotase [Exilispira sp.]
MKSLLHGGILVDKSCGLNEVKKDIIIENGIITSIVDPIDLNSIQNSEYEIHILDDLLIFPGFIDLHTHFRYPGFSEKEDLISGSFAALHGGYTTCVAMPNTNPPVDNFNIFKQICEESLYIDIIQSCCITKQREGKQLANLVSLSNNGVLIFTDDGSEVKDPDLIFEALKLSSEYNFIIMEHSLFSDFFKCGVINHGRVSSLLNLKSIPEVAETSLVFRDIELAKMASGNLHLTHLSCAKSVDLCIEAKNAGYTNISFDVAPHHLLLDDESCASMDPVFKVSPPLRSKDMVKKLQSYLFDGKIKIIATDHAPHTEVEKKLDFETAPSGITGLETSFSLLYSEFVINKRMSLMDLVTLFTSNPAECIKLKKKGHLKKGDIADISVFDPHRETTIDESFFFSKAKISPYLNRVIEGKIVQVYKNGSVVFDNLNDKKKALFYKKVNIDLSY